MEAVVKISTTIHDFKTKTTAKTGSYD